VVICQYIFMSLLSMFLCTYCENEFPHRTINTISIYIYLKMHKMHTWKCHECLTTQLQVDAVLLKCDNVEFVWLKWRLKHSFVEILDNQLESILWFSDHSWVTWSPAQLSSGRPPQEDTWLGGGPTTLLGGPEGRPRGEAMCHGVNWNRPCCTEGPVLS